MTDRDREWLRLRLLETRAVRPKVRGAILKAIDKAAKASPSPRSGSPRCGPSERYRSAAGKR